MQALTFLTRFFHVWAFCLVLVQVEAQDSLYASRKQLVDDLMHHRILSERGRDQIKIWIDHVSSSPYSLSEVYIRQLAPGPLLMDLAMAGNAYRTIEWYRYVGDSLSRNERLMNSLANERRGHHNLRIVIERIRSDFSDRNRPPPRTDLGAEALAWAATDTVFAKELAELEWHLGYVDALLFAGQRSPEQLIEDLHEIGLFDEWLAEDLRLDLRCDRIYDVAELLKLIDRNTNHRIWKEQSRQKAENRIKALVSSGFMDAPTGEQLLRTQDPYSWPSDFEIAVASSPHLILDCDERVWTAESYYTEYLPKLAGIVPELAPTKVHVVRRPADQAIVSVEYQTEVSFVDHGRRYAFHVFEGREGVVEGPSSGCFMMFLALKTLNKALCDAGSKYRLIKHEFTDDECGLSGRHQMCLAFVDQARCDVWWPNPKTILEEHQRSYRCDELFSTKFCKDSIAALVSDLASLGILRHLTTSQIDSATAQANATMPGAWADVLQHYPELLVWPAGNRYAPLFEGDLEKQLLSISAISQGVVTISHIKEHWGTKQRGTV
ncbi:MAG: hypothetical protein WEC15_06730 [Flavobacteriales bacterium]